MKYLILLLVSTAAFAGTITLEENGVKRTFPTTGYYVGKKGPAKKKVVAAAKPKATAPQPEQAKCVSTAEEAEHTAHAIMELNEALYGQKLRKNRIRAVGGIGPQGVAVDGGPAEYTVSPSMKAVVGVGYSRLITDRISLDAQALTNKTYTLGVGFDW